MITVFCESRLHRHVSTFALAFVLLIVLPSATTAQQQLPEKVAFNAHIRPLMSKTCFTCHGPDESHNESEFRIDSFETATGELPSDDELVGIKPGDPSGSEVYLRLIDEGDGEKMPPENFRHQLSEYEIALFKKWIEQGAEYQQHWSYSPVTRPATPKPQKFSQLAGNDIDTFILKRLEQSELKPAEIADKATLLRRLSLDLIGLPPTPEEVTAFLADESPGAYKKQVERLLASPHFGERMASYWLDLVRFADTVGFHGDQNQRVFPYRDYVIDSFNNNKPFDQFTREQLAGDLLPNPTEQQLVATAFLRLNMVTREGGAQPNEYLAKYKADRVRALGTAWMGSTLGCCECHNHKYDPFTAKDFYSFGAFFDDLQQWGVYSNYVYTPNPDLNGFSNDHPFPPELRLESETLKKEIRTLMLERDQQLASQIKLSESERKEFASWLRQISTQTKHHADGWQPLTVEKAVSTATETTVKTLADQSVLITGAPTKSETIELATGVEEPVWINSIRLQVLPDEANNGHVGRSETGHFSVGVEASLDDRVQTVVEKSPNTPRFIRVELPGQKRILSLAEFQVFDSMEDDAANLALAGKATQSTDYHQYSAKLAIDGNTDGDANKAASITHTQTQDDPWWELDLGKECSVQRIKVWNRINGNLEARLKGYRVIFLDEQRRILYRHSPDLPEPSTEFEPPALVRPESGRNLSFAWSTADRRSERGYANGKPPRYLSDTWRSGPGRWQLPTDETKLVHTAIYHLSEPVLVTADQQLIIRLSSKDIGRVRIDVASVGHAQPGWAAIAPNLKEALDTPPSKRTEMQRQRLLSAYHVSTQPINKQNSIAVAYRDRIADLNSGYAMTLIAQTIPADKIPVSRVLPRGNWQDETGDVTPPAFPEFLPSTSNISNGKDDSRLTRLDLANWLVASENPLTARHFVNRTWRQFFANGLSAKIDDLGNQGEWPSHPLLMDWMASEFVESGWDVKHIVRMIVNSRTYRQKAATSDLKSIDPYNRLLSQQSARRLEAEIVRDNALAIAGLLRSDYVGGRSVFPWQPDGHYSNLQFPNRRYKPDRDWRQYRRGVYMHWQRTFLHPMLVNFDAPSRDECAADRPLSNSPQQALTLLNDPTFVEASIAFSQRLAKENLADDTAVLNRAFELALARSIQPQEETLLLGLLKRQTEHFQSNPDDAKKSLTAGMRSPLTNADIAEQAAWAQVCRVILNLHETITRF